MILSSFQIKAFYILQANERIILFVLKWRKWAKRKWEYELVCIWNTKRQLIDKFCNTFVTQIPCKKLQLPQIIAWEFLYTFQNLITFDL